MTRVVGIDLGTTSSCVAVIGGSPGSIAALEVDLASLAQAARAAVARAPVAILDVPGRAAGRERRDAATGADAPYRDGCSLGPLPGK